MRRVSANWMEIKKNEKTQQKTNVVDEKIEDLSVSVRVCTSPSKTESKEYQVLAPICSISFRIEYNPSVKDERDTLYDMLNDVSTRKAAAIDELRKSASVFNRVKMQSADSITSPSIDKKHTSEGNALKPGFLIQGKKNIGMFTKISTVLMSLYNHTISHDSLLRSFLIPMMKNYFIFLGAVALMHYQGQKLALPSPV